MRWLVVTATCVACSSPPPPTVATAAAPPVIAPVAPPPPPPPAPAPVVVEEPPAPPPARFEPTAFTVDVTGSGRPVILIPGLGCPAAVWAGTIEHYRKQYELHAIHAAGFAGHPPIDRPVISAMREQLVDYIRDRKLDRPIVIGHSMGGFLAIWLAETAPELIGGLVIVDSGPTLGGGDPAWEPFAKKQRDAYHDMDAVRFEKTIRERFSPMFGDPVKYEPLIAAVAKSDHVAYSEAYWELNTIDLRPELHKLTMPTLLVEADLPQSKRYGRHLAQLKRLKVVQIPNTKHFVMLDAPADFYRELDAFIAAH